MLKKNATICLALLLIFGAIGVVYTGAKQLKEYLRQSSLFMPG